jgi:hypothetical protein
LSEDNDGLDYELLINGVPKLSILCALSDLFGEDATIAMEANESGVKIRVTDIEVTTR